MNLYRYFVQPSRLDLYEEADLKIPAVFYEKYSHDPVQLRDRQQHIATSARYSFKYATQHVGKFRLGEPAIATKSDCACYYAMRVLHRPFPLGEATIAKNARYSYLYAENVLRQRFVLGEAAIATHPQYAVDYAQRVIKGPFPLGEAAIAKTPITAYQYARNILNAPFPLADAAVAADPYIRLLYNNWVKGENYEPV